MIPSLILPDIFLPFRDETLSLQKKHAHYLARVLRLQPGDPVFLLDGRGNRCRAEILEVSRLSVSLKVGDTERLDSESPLKITIIQGLPKPGKMDWIVQKATELGVIAIAPVITERSQVRCSGASATGGVGRWRKIAESATAQSGRGIVPEIYDPEPLDVFFQKQKYLGSGRGLVFWEKAEKSLKTAIPEVDSGSLSNLSVFVGPEGGLTVAEVGMAEEAGFVQASLGSRILRTETAAVVAIGLLQFALGDLG